MERVSSPPPSAVAMPQNRRPGRHALPNPNIHLTSRIPNLPSSMNPPIHTVHRTAPPLTASRHRLSMILAQVGLLLIAMAALAGSALAQSVDVQPIDITRNPSSIAPGGSLSVTWKIRNNGTGTAASSNTQERISSSSSSSGGSSSNVGTSVSTGTIAGR